MKKFIFVVNAIELLKQLLAGKRVEGVLYFDKNAGRLTFKAYNRTCPKHRVLPEVLIRKTPLWTGDQDADAFQALHQHSHRHAFRQETGHPRRAEQTGQGSLG